MGCPGELFRRPRSRSVRPGPSTTAPSHGLLTRKPDIGVTLPREGARQRLRVHPARALS